MDHITDSNSPFNKSDSEIQRFYENKKIFITGGTGFLGKLLIEKLLRSTDVSTIYLLIRSKKGKSINSRLDDYFNDIIFQKLKSEVKQFKHKIIGISGDCSLAGLGISLEDRRLLTDNIEVIFHVAATVNFDEKLKLAYSINVKGTESVLNLCRESKHLKAYVHVSTIYCQSHLTEIDEVFYDPLVNYKDLEVVLEKLDEKSIDKYLPKILGKSPNTYTFTKSLAEALIKDEGAGLPIGIFRPAIVISTYREPIGGWIDNLYGPTGVITAAASGVLRTLQCDSNVLANVVPADTCIAALIVSAWDVASRQCERTASNTPIYNYISTEENPLTWGEYTALNKLWAETYPISTSLWAIKLSIVTSKIATNLQRIFYHLLPALILDIFSLIGGKKPRMITLYSKIHKFTDVISYFATSEWKCVNQNVLKLWYKLNKTDRELFPLSMTTVQWPLYFKTEFLGIRKYLLKDLDSTIPYARTRNFRFHLLHIFLKFILTTLTANYIWNNISRSLEWFITKKSLI